MKPVRLVQGRAVPLDRSDIDTDQIIPSDWLKQVERSGFEKGLFSEWRDDPNFILNHQDHLGAPILITGPNFGTGSSREHAVWAIMQYGFEAVISPRFGPIFENNSAKNGLVCVTVDRDLTDLLMRSVKSTPDLEIVVDLERLRLEVPALGIDVNFEMDPSVQRRFLDGLDDIGVTLRLADQIAKYEQDRPRYMPRTEAV